MLYVVTGGSGSGKSEYAEQLAVCFSQISSVGMSASNTSVGKLENTLNRGTSLVSGGLYYIATMQANDAESCKRIQRHRKMRAGKGFTTVECALEIEQIEASGQDVLLLECMSNLLANEMYLETGRVKDHSKQSIHQLEYAILEPLLLLEKKAKCMIIVTNEVFSDSSVYEEEIKWYLRLLGVVNQRLAAAADGVVEVVCGIPVIHKDTGRILSKLGCHQQLL